MKRPVNGYEDFDLHVYGSLKYIIIVPIIFKVLNML